MSSHEPSLPGFRGNGGDPGGSFGVSISKTNAGISNLLVKGNVIYNTCTGLPGCAAVFIDDADATATKPR
jgi:hypothetical protein